MHTAPTTGAPRGLGRPLARGLARDGGTLASGARDAAGPRAAGAGAR
ncbi:hypothetical protein [Actinomadura rifamycini]|nr:hypothetical protein [Actinomadura rifamycini]